MQLAMYWPSASRVACRVSTAGEWYDRENNNVGTRYFAVHSVTSVWRFSVLTVIG